ncbi:murein transglycosylase [Fusarium heterosporum]|uniref:Murein transglycosylase n=1 Tax=Fusarium heterosporum TaxID=42747 RepID=A0A8H5TEN4_FUSHE|nr:murein transglycosylase [Fusarium heterosporum]
MSSQPSNPIIPGFSPDPSIVKVGEWYFLVNSTFHMFPGIPVYASKDLILWKHIGNVIHRREQISLKKSDTEVNKLPGVGEVMLATGGLYAPTIRYHKGTFYVVCTNVVRVIPKAKGESDINENFIASTKDIWSGQWSDLVKFDFDGIDPSMLFDDDGKVYIQGSKSPGPFTRIAQFEVDIETGRKLSEEKILWEGTGGVYPEGPHIYKRNGWYCLMISEGGTHDEHMITMARSRDVWGPYEPCPNNPILVPASTDFYVRHTGHCDAFEDENGQWWGVCLGVRRDKTDRYNMGRESFLTTAKWTDDWLRLDSVEAVIDSSRLASANAVQGLTAVDNVDYLYIRDPSLENYDFGNGNKSLTLTSSSVDLSHPRESPTFVGKRQRVHNGQSSATVLIDSSWTNTKLKTGLACYKDEHRYLRVYYDAGDNAVGYEAINAAKDISKTEKHALDRDVDSLRFRMVYTEAEYRIEYAAGQEAWVCIATLDTIDMTGPDFVGPVIGVFALDMQGAPTVEVVDLQVE